MEVKNILQKIKIIDQMQILSFKNLHASSSLQLNFQSLHLLSFQSRNLSLFYSDNSCPYQSIFPDSFLIIYHCCLRSSLSKDQLLNLEKVYHLRYLSAVIILSLGNFFVSFALLAWLSRLGFHHQGFCVGFRSPTNFWKALSVAEIYRVGQPFGWRQQTAGGIVGSVLWGCQNIISHFRRLQSSTFYSIFYKFQKYILQLIILMIYLCQIININTKNQTQKIQVFMDFDVINQKLSTYNEFCSRILTIIRSACVQLVQEETAANVQESLDEDDEIRGSSSLQGGQIQCKQAEFLLNGQHQDGLTYQSQEGKEDKCKVQGQIKKRGFLSNKKAQTKKEGKMASKKLELKDENMLNIMINASESDEKKVRFNEIIMVKNFKKSESASCVGQAFQYFEGINYSRQNIKNLQMKALINEYQDEQPQKPTQFGKKTGKLIKIDRQISQC